MGKKTYWIIFESIPNYHFKTNKRKHTRKNCHTSKSIDGLFLNTHTRTHGPKQSIENESYIELRKVFLFIDIDFHSIIFFLFSPLSESEWSIDERKHIRKFATHKQRKKRSARNRKLHFQSFNLFDLCLAQHCIEIYTEIIRQSFSKTTDIDSMPPNLFI